MLDTLRSGWITTGPKAKRFEQEFAGYVGAKHALALSHCTGALHLALWALGIGPGDEVITTPFTFTATAEVIGYLGARPVFVDVDPGTFNINPARIEEALESGANKRVRALLPVHFAGQACDMDRILKIARNYNLKIVEDAAHAVGSARHLDGRGMAKIGTIGDLTCFSFYATKNFTTAEGGMITTDRRRAGRKNRRRQPARNEQGRVEALRPRAARGTTKSTTWVSNTTCLTCTPPSDWPRSSARDDFMRRRGEIARAYNEALRADDALQTAYSEPGIEHAWHLYVLRLRPERLKVGRNQFVEILRERGVGCSVHCIPLHTMHYYQRSYGYRDGDFPVAEDIFSRCLSLPIYPR